MTPYGADICLYLFNLYVEEVYLKRIYNQNGQGLVEYLILTALLAIATMGVVRLLGHSVSARYADVVNAVQGRDAPKVDSEQVAERHYKKRDMGDFMRGAASSSRNEPD